MKRLFLLPFISCLLLAFDCRAGTEGYIKRNELMTSYEKARASILSEASVMPDVLWGLAQIKRHKPDRALDAFIAEQKRRMENQHYLPGVFTTAPRIPLPVDPGEGISRFFNYVKAPFGAPEERALTFIQQYIADDQDGYILTHQFLCLVWAEQAGLPVSESMLLRKEQLLQRIYDEQRAVPDVDSLDLYMERVALLLMYEEAGRLDVRLVHRWLRTILDLQLADGSWPLSKTRIEYDGASTMLTSPRSHTTVLGMMVLHTGSEGFRSASSFRGRQNQLD